MGLFGSNEKQEETPKKIRPTVVRTQSVAKEIVELAKRSNINPNSLDFNILSVQTFTRTNTEKEVDWQEIEDGQKIVLDEIKEVLNSKFQIKQAYEIEIFSKHEEDLFKDFHTAVGANATKCKIYLSIKAGSKIPLIPKIENELLKYINKSKIKAGILINVFDEMLDDTLSKISAVAKVHGGIEYSKNETILIAESYEPTPTTNDNFLFHYEKEEKSDEKERVDYSNRGFIHSVLEGDVLMEYIKPKKGKPGRNCRGEFLEPLEPLVNNVPSFTVDETIEVSESEDSIIYRAKINGYISKEANVYKIKSEMAIGEISFKTTGSISTGLDSEVSLNVNESDTDKDAIGSGMEVEVSEIDVKGNVGSNAKIHARRANIEGQTHKTSTVKADDLTLNVHKGIAIGENVKIVRLEHGTVEAKKVNITQAMGGTIFAREAEIEICNSHVKVTASKKIVINKLQGSENVFVIDPLMQSEGVEKLEKNKHEVQELEKSINEIKKEMQKYEKLIKDNAASFNEVKKRLLHYKQNGIKMPTAFVEKFKQFNKYQEHLDTITDEYKIKNDKLIFLTSKTATYQDSLVDARIINRDRWVGHNEIIFKLVSPQIELSYKPAEGSIGKIFAVVQNSDGVYEIRAVNE